VSAAGVSASAPGESDAGAPNPASPTSPVILLSATGDQDGDGQNNGDEQAAGTNPLDVASRFAVKSVGRTGNVVTVTWQSVSGKSYIVQSRPSLETGSWADIPGSTTPGTGGEVSFDHTVALGDATMFYRVRTAP
jgi:hypothetical protein